MIRTTLLIIALNSITAIVANPNGCPVYLNSQPGDSCDDGRTLVDFEKLPSFRLLNFDECGKVDTKMQRQSRGRISNGANAKLFELPWNAQLGYKNVETNEINFECGGSLISGKKIIIILEVHKICLLFPDYFVLTAASCLMTKSHKERKV
jgi:hypothetical protein